MRPPAIRAVQEFFCPSGRCREVQLADGQRHPVLLSVEQIGRSEGSGHAAEAAALRISYRGREKDLIALGCICRDKSAAAPLGHAAVHGRGDALQVQRRQVPGRRGLIEVSYLARSRSAAGILPGVRTYCGDWLREMATPPLRLIINNIRRDPVSPPAQPLARLSGA